MRTKSFAVLLGVLVLLLVPRADAVTFEELAGTYVGKRTETYASDPGVLRYNEIIIITAGGLVTSYIEFNDEYLLASSGTLDLNPDGSFGDELTIGQLTLNGRHLRVKVQFFPPFFPDVVVQFQGRRAASGFELPFSPGGDSEEVSGFPLWAPVD